MPKREETKRISAADHTIEARTAAEQGRFGNLRDGAVRLPGIGSGLALEVLIVREWKTVWPGGTADSIWEGGEPFYGTRTCPVWYQSGAGVASGSNVPFSVLRMLMQASGKPTPKPRKGVTISCFGFHPRLGV
jgi:hypothetical protein